MATNVEEEATRLKNEGNEWFKLGKFQKAIDSYSASLELVPAAAVYCNRALMYIKIELAGAAIADADAALALDPTFVKAYYRKASAHLELGKHKEALKDFRHVVAIAPHDADAQAKCALCEKEVRRIAFLNAIASEDSAPISQRIKRDWPIPPTYNGPLLEGDTLTLDYVVAMMKQFKEEKTIAKRDLITILLKANEVLKALPNFVPVTVPDDEEITVCGDTHGQFYDLLNIFEINGTPGPTCRYLFNGDFVDRGSYSCEVAITLLAFKALFPEFVFLSRGNHEGMSMNRVYGFEGELKAKYDDSLYPLFCEVFCSLPLGHIINQKVFVLHGGLYSRDDVTIDELQKVKRFREIPEEGVMCESLWADPQPGPGRSPSQRGVGHSFGPDVTKKFLELNNLELVVRSHEVKDNGYEIHHGGKCITVFSAPNYCDRMGNKGAFIRFRGSEMKPKFTTFSHVPHPGKAAMQYSSAFSMM